MLTLPNVNRASSGEYRLVSLNLMGSATSAPATLRVLVPQQIRQIARAADGSIQLLFNDSDGNAGSDLSRFEVQSSVQVPSTNWLTLTNALRFAEGMILFRDDALTNAPQRFYRAVER